MRRPEDLELRGHLAQQLTDLADRGVRPGRHRAQFVPAPRVGAAGQVAGGHREGAYQLVVVDDGAPDAATNDPDYFQTDATGSSVFTVAPC